MPSFRPRTPASENSVKEAEKNLHLHFSEEYKDYLLRFGCAAIYGHEFTGLCHSSRLNVLDVTAEEKKLTPFIPDDWYAVEQTNIDGIVIWQNQNGEVFQSHPCGTMRKIANSLLEYLLR